MAEHTGFLQRVVLKNYKSIEACDVALQPLTFLVGRNGSGKSNFLDSIRFVSDSLVSSIDHALRERGGIDEVRRRSAGHPTHFGIRLEFRLPDGRKGFYAFRIGAQTDYGFKVLQEVCQCGAEVFEVKAGKVVATTMRISPPASADRLHLVQAAGQAGFRDVFDALVSCGFYSINPDRVRDLQSPSASPILLRDGSNLASILGRLAKRDPSVKRRIEEYLGVVVPGVTEVLPKDLGPKETVEFRQDVAGFKNPVRFLASNMSDGTLRALAILTALFQPANGSARSPFIGIEEPEASLHPAAARALIHSFRDASAHTQVLVTSHSAELLDEIETGVESVFAVIMNEGVTVIGQLDTANLEAIQQHLYSAGDLLRMDQLRPDLSAAEKSRQADLFEVPAR